jgi:hypothetical protein
VQERVESQRPGHADQLPRGAGHKRRAELTGHFTPNERAEYSKTFGNWRAVVSIAVTVDGQRAAGVAVLFSSSRQGLHFTASSNIDWRRTSKREAESNAPQTSLVTAALGPG